MGNIEEADNLEGAIEDWFKSIESLISELENRNIINHFEKEEYIEEISKANEETRNFYISRTDYLEEPNDDDEYEYLTFNENDKREVRVDIFSDVDL